MIVPAAYILVYSTSHAIRIEKALQAAAIGCKLVPVPRHLSSDCGVCVRVSLMDCAAAEPVIQACGVEVEGIFEEKP